MVNDSLSPIPQVEEKSKQYTTSYVKRSYHAKIFQHITVQLVNQILHAVYNNILKNIPILREYVGMSQDIYETSVPHLRGKKVCHNIQNMEPIIIQNFPKGILDKYKKVILCCDIMHINGIGFLNTLSWNIMLATGNIIKNRILKNIEFGIMQVYRIYLQHGLKITHIYSHRKFEPLRAYMADIGISLNCASKKEHVPQFELFNQNIKERVQSA